MKFTEEQYQKIVDIWNNEYSYIEGMKRVFNYISSEHLANNAYEAAALANPAVRELAHELFVEEEKRYVWTSKKVDKNGIKMHLYKDYFGRVLSFLSVKNVNIYDNEKLTESEIREWGYNPDMFDKEEVK